MSDDPLKSIADAMPQTGWIAAVLMSTWAFTLRFLIGRYVKSLDEVVKQLAKIDSRLSKIEGRFEERDNGD